MQAAAPVPLERLSIAVAQMTSVDDLQNNLKQIYGHLDQVVAHGGVDLVSFPENALYMRLQTGRPIEYVSLDHPVLRELSEWSCTHECAIHLGASPLQMDRKHWNATVLLLPDGTIATPYQKVHLFDVDLEGQRAIRESDAFTHGDHPSVWMYRGWKLGLSICYDIRFSELYRVYRDQQVDAILVPSAFTVPTGQAHWEILLRARAIESQCYVLAAAQAGTHRSQTGEERSTYGHSLIIDPWGVVVAEAQTMGSQLLFSTLEKTRLSQVRRQIPMAQHWRLP